MLEKTCFAYKLDNSQKPICTALEEIYCRTSNKPCKFFKTQKQLLKERQLADWRLEEISESTKIAQEFKKIQEGRRY